ncbi:MAG TPA: hypothetical protein PK286_06010 [Devosia sp.]|nr:hypothetical protein [Devosia sp.]
MRHLVENLAAEHYPAQILDWGMQMSLKSFRNRARYNVLTPVFLLGVGLAAVPALAANPTYDVVIPVDGNLTNSQTIYNDVTSFAVTSDGDVDFITNLASGVIQSNGSIAVDVNGSINSLTNNGAIVGDANAIIIDGDVGSFVNTGRINADTTAVFIGGDVGSFSNSGRITSGSYAVYLDGGVDTFVNSGRIVSGSTGVYIGGDVGSFNNSGYISADDYEGVDIDGNVGSFTNSGDIIAYTTGVNIDGTVDSFTNSGFIKSADYTGVYISDDVGSFSNSGRIHSYSEGVEIHGATGSFTNSGDIISAAYTGVYFEGEVTSFSNSGTISGGSATGVYFYDDVGSFTNSGLIEGKYDGYGVYADDMVDSFANSGTIRGQFMGVSIGGDVESFSNSGDITSFDETGVYIGGDVGTFSNSGDISAEGPGVYIGSYAASVSNSGSISGSVGYGLYLGYGVGSVSNSGDISSYMQGVYVSGNIDSFNNSGWINSSDYTGIYISGDVGSFVNSGEITSYSRGLYVSGSAGSITNSGLISTNFYDGVYVSGNVDSFNNSGEIYSGSSTGVDIGGNVGSFTNSGLIHSLESYGVYISGTTDAFANSGAIDGSISGYAGVYFYDDVLAASNSGRISGDTGVIFDGGGGTTFTNSGLIEGYGGRAVQFRGGDDTLALGTGASFFGDVDFGGGDDTLNLAAYRGNIILDYVDSLETIVPGNNIVVQEPNQVFVVNTDAIQQSGLVTSTLVGGVTDLLGSQLSGLGSGGGGADAASEHAIVGETTASSGFEVWASGLGGGLKSQNSDMSAFGAGMIGAHTDLGGFKLGGTIGAAISRADVAGGSQVIDTRVGVGGIYGSADLDVVELTFSLLGGAGTNHSARTVETDTGPQVATADYGTWFIAPTVGVSMPVLTDDMHEVRIGGSVGWVGGQNAAYTESGNEGVLSVGAQRFGVVTAKLEISDSITIGETDAGDINGIVKVAGFVQSNVGGADTAVDIYDFSGGAIVGSGISAASSGTVFGAQASLGVEAPVVAGVDVNAGVAATARSDGALGGNVWAGLKGSF